jgi:hypothetical protein
MTMWVIRNTIEVHGLQKAGELLRHRVFFDTFYFSIFGRYPTRKFSSTNK